MVFRYCDRKGNVTTESNANGAQRNIAGIADKTGRIVGLMPHPENAAEAALGSTRRSPHVRKRRQRTRSGLIGDTMFPGIHAIAFALFNADETLDRAAMRRQTEICLASGVDGMAALGLATEVSKLQRGRATSDHGLGRGGCARPRARCLHDLWQFRR